VCNLLLSSITKYSGQCGIIPFSQVLQSTVSSAISFPYVKYYNLQPPLRYHPLMSRITIFTLQCGIIPLYQVLQTTAACAVSSPYIKLLHTTAASALSSPYVKCYKLQRSLLYHPLLSRISYSGQCSTIPLRRMPVSHLAHDCLFATIA